MQSEAVQFLSVDEAIAIHERLIERFGGTSGIRDKGLLESALYRPQTGYYEDLAEMAAALFQSLLLNHAFLDGNKRAAFFVTDTFLRLNGWKLSVNAASTYDHIVGMLNAGDSSFDEILAWIKASLAKS
ncbi:MAG: type II toxin-antitoxin system death-on-curing family toxin [Gammaproteobacteria bacterium]|nr:type II toxin-antitoxin system death-on-curing family toxin [Gammaproteobacteria bacterium]MDE0223973.1 type II toxin-antitoxin system death-on-curing family toxin [Gammaproteobacteria bacterium]